MRVRFLNLRHYGLRRWLRLVIFFAGLYLITFGFVLPWTCYEWAYSKYFSMPKNKTTFVKRATILNDAAKRNAQDYFKTLNATETKELYEKLMKSDSIDLSIGVITMKRNFSDNNPGYLTQTLAQLDRIIKRNRILHFNPGLFVCDVNSGKEVHEEANILEQYFVSRHVTKQKAKPANRYEKEKQDYIFCIEQALSTKAKYILMIEDDTLPNDDIFYVLHHLLTNHDRLSQGHAGEKELGHSHGMNSASNWAFLKLFYPPRWRGFGWELRHVADLLSISVAGGMLLLLFVNLTVRSRRFSFKRREELIIFLFGSLYFALFVVLIGKPYVTELLAVSKHLYRVSHAPECCTPAVLFTKENALELAEYLKTQTCELHYELDLAMDSFVSSKNYAKYLVEPNLVKHIGMVSSIKSGNRFPQEFIFR